LHAYRAARAQLRRQARRAPYPRGAAGAGARAGAGAHSRSGGLRSDRLHPRALQQQRPGRAPARRYPCIYCGPSTEYDFELIDEDKEEEAYAIMDNFKAAYANKRAPRAAAWPRRPAGRPTELKS